VAFQGLSSDSGSASIGHVVHSPLIQATRAATEAHFLMLDRLFHSGYRRVVWSCDAHNEASVRAAQRLGF
jgi:RimJ/RimL family protein N-acetyltransferase